MSCSCPAPSASRKSPQRPVCASSRFSMALRGHFPGFLQTRLERERELGWGGAGAYWDPPGYRVVLIVGLTGVTCFCCLAVKLLRCECEAF